MNKPIILLSATINCANTPLTKRQDPGVREADYGWALEGWMRVKAYDTLIFCENSNADLSSLEKRVQTANVLGHNVIFLSCDKNNEAAMRGKGYGEMSIIRHVIDSLPDLPPGQTIVKVTGRYRSLNAEGIVRLIGQTDADISCTLRGRLTYADSVLFAIKQSCIERHLLPLQEQLDDLGGVYFEHVLAKAVHSTLLSGGSWSPLPCYPSLYGTSGTNGKTVGASIVSRTAAATRNLLEQLLHR